MKAVFACNAYVDEAGAVGAAQDRSRRGWPQVLGTLVVAMRLLAVAIAPIIPDSAAQPDRAIDAGRGGQPIAQPLPLFPRLELQDEDDAA